MYVNDHIIPIFAFIDHLMLKKSMCSCIVFILVNSKIKMVTCQRTL